MTGRYAFHTGMTGNQSGGLLTPAKEINLNPAVGILKILASY
jgi:arylsulfatase A-like enzyme